MARPWIAAGALLVVTAASAGSKQVLPPAAEAAVRGLLPEGTIEQVGREREHGVEYYEVAVRHRGVLREVEVTADGSIGEIESRIDLAELPQAARARILAASGGEVPRTVELHEVRGTAQGGTFTPVRPPLVFYEASWVADGARREIVVTADGGTPPSSVAEDQDSGPDDDLDDDGAED